MTPKDLNTRLTADPFKPFEIITTRTGRYSVNDPRHALLTRTKLILARTVGADGIIDEVQEIPLAQITKLG